jgi:hypothetical protein
MKYTNRLYFRAKTSVRMRVQLYLRHIVIRTDIGPTSVRSGPNSKFRNHINRTDAFFVNSDRPVCPL